MYDDQYPVVDDWVLTGDHVFKSEKLDEAANRIFKLLTGLNTSYYRQFRAFGNPERIKNDRDLLWVKSLGVDTRTISVAYYFALPVEQVKTLAPHSAWYPIQDLPELGFDHREIIQSALLDIQEKVMNDPIIFEFLPDKFTLNELQHAYESILGVEIDNRNFRKKIIAKPYIVSINEKRIGTAKKPANLYMFSKDIFIKTSDKHQIINI